VKREYSASDKAAGLSAVHTAKCGVTKGFPVEGQCRALWKAF